MEWANLAGDSRYAEVKQDLAKWLPTVNAEEGPRASKAKRTKPAKARQKKS